jgi:CubicO group peptidase (beta-lactamase class C family)
MIKPMTALGIAMLKDEGKLAFDDPVEKYLPEFKELKGPNGQPLARPITLRDLLTHTSGLGDYSLPDPHWTLEQISKDATGRPLRAQPGVRWSYSTTGINILGHVVEVVSGTPFAVFMQKRLFDPLGMKHTSFWVASADATKVATSYVADASGKLQPTTISYMYGAAVTDPARPPIGGAGLFSTAEDVVKVYQMMLHGGSHNGQVIIKPETAAEMIRNQTGEMSTRPGMAWGLGFCVVLQSINGNAVLSPGSFGHGGAYGTNSWADPKRDVIYVLMLQRDKIRPTPDDSAMRIAFQQAASDAFGK